MSKTETVLPNPATAASIKSEPEPTKRVAKKTTKKKTASNMVTMTKAELEALVKSASEAAVAAVASKGKKTNEEKAAKKAAAAKERAAKKAAQKASNDAKKAAHAEFSGKTLDEVKAAWTEAHKYADQFQKEVPAAERAVVYKTRFDEKLKELLGVVRFAA